MTEEQMREIADDADEWSVSCRTCNAPQWHVCQEPWESRTEPHRARIIDATIAAIRRAAGEAGPGAA